MHASAPTGTDAAGAQADHGRCAPRTSKEAAGPSGGYSTLPHREATTLPAHLSGAQPKDSMIDTTEELKRHFPLTVALTLLRGTPRPSARQGTVAGPAPPRFQYPDRVGRHYAPNARMMHRAPNARRDEDEKGQVSLRSDAKRVSSGKKRTTTTAIPTPTTPAAKVATTDSMKTERTPVCPRPHCPADQSRAHALTHHDRDVEQAERPEELMIPPMTMMTVRDHAAVSSPRPGARRGNSDPPALTQDRLQAQGRRPPGLLRLALPQAIIVGNSSAGRTSARHHSGRTRSACRSSSVLAKRHLQPPARMQDDQVDGGWPAGSTEARRSRRA